MGRFSLFAPLLLATNGVLGAKWIGEVKKVDGVDYQCKQSPLFDSLECILIIELQANATPTTPAGQPIKTGRSSIRLSRAHYSSPSHQALFATPTSETELVFTMRRSVRTLKPTGQMSNGCMSNFVGEYK